MHLNQDMYRALEDIVGSENISEEPAILDSYAFQYLGELMPAGKGERFVFRPEAVLLPGSTEEVQAIVRACNRYNIKFKAFSTGWGAWSGPGSDGVIQLDLRRMNRILEIDEKNMCAVVEPYVIGARLQAELMKRGLNCQIITAGSNTSALPLAALNGFGPNSVSMSVHPRNVLGVEWVLPTGEVVRLGSLGSGAGWFCGDGPGPSLRSVIKGADGLQGGLGVFTKAATKVYHWPGPPVPPQSLQGVSPSYKMKSIPQMHSYYLTFHSWDKLIEAGILIAESEIASMLVSMPQYQLAGSIATSNDNWAKLYLAILEYTKRRPCALVIIRAISKREFNYQEKVLNRILEETQGECQHFLDQDDIQNGTTWHYSRMSTGVREAFRFSGGSTQLAVMGNWTRTSTIRVGLGTGTTEEYRKKGLILDDAGDGGISMSIENGHMAMTAIGAIYDPSEPESWTATKEIIAESNKIAMERYKWPPPAQAGHDVVGPMLNNYHVWLRKIKQTFDPNTSSDPTDYIRP